MMGIGPGDARGLSLREFLAIRSKWNARHRNDSDAGEKVGPPSEETVRMAQAELYELGIATGSA